MRLCLKRGRRERRGEVRREQEGRGKVGRGQEERGNLSRRLGSAAWRWIVITEP